MSGRGFAVTSIALALCATLAGCTNRGMTPTARSLEVVATIYPLCDWIRVISGSKAEAYCLLKPGANPHTYEPQPRDAQSIERAALFVMVGEGLEPWAEKLAASAPNAKIVRLGQGLATIGADVGRVEPNTRGADHDVEDNNPHVWMSPRLARVMVSRLADNMAQADPPNARLYRANAAAYNRQLVSLEAEVKLRLAPFRGRQVITFHSAFDYLLQDVGLKLKASIEPYPGKEPSAQYLQQIVLWMRASNIRTVFAEPQFSPKAAQVIASEVGGQVLVLDDLGDPDDPTRDTYIKLIRYDTGQLVKALGGDTP